MNHFGADPAALSDFDCALARITDPAELDALAERMIAETERAAIKARQQREVKRAARGYGWGV